MKIGNVLSLFDGMSCGQIALKVSGIDYYKYYASEIDKHAVKQSSFVFPNTIYLGDVTKWKEWDIEWEKVDLLLAGSPCQGFSRAGKGLNFDDPRSKLFFVFVDILNHAKKANPNVKFLLENVDMDKLCLGVISREVMVYPVNINSNLVSGQNRNRWYWTNIRTKEVGMFAEIHSDIPQPQDRGILLRDILQPNNEIADKYYVSTKEASFVRNEIRQKKSYTMVCNNYNKAITLMARMYASWNGNYVQNNNTNTIRRLTPLECSRLQTIPEWYNWNVSNTQIYKMLGNGLTVDVIAHIFKYLKHENK